MIQSTAGLRGARHLLGHEVSGDERGYADERVVTEGHLPDVSEDDIERQADDGVDDGQ
jgi:hypothetical protein